MECRAQADGDVEGRSVQNDDAATRSGLGAVKVLDLVSVGGCALALLSAGVAPVVVPPAPFPALAPGAAVAARGAVGVVGRLAYAPTVHEALNQACSGCHRSGRAASSTGFLLTSEVAADFTSARRFVNLAQPVASPLLREGSGVAHAGGAVFPPESVGYRLLLRWIQLGAVGPTDVAPVAAAARAPLAP